MYVSNVFLLGTEEVFVSFVVQKSILTVVSISQDIKNITFKKMRIKANSVFLKPVFQNA